MAFVHKAQPHVPSLDDDRSSRSLKSGTPEARESAHYETKNWYEDVQTSGLLQGKNPANYEDELLRGATRRHHDGDKNAQRIDPSKPTLERSWEVVMKEVESLDDGSVKGWKEDIDTLLVFAGLFSAVVTAFAVESYQWLEQQPEDATVTLLKQISWQQANGTAAPPAPQFDVSASVVRINVLWFLSLIIALVDALFALLCKQWLREHSRHTHTRTPAEALALRWLRMQSLEKWHVPAILASLPILLECALFLFLAGLLELLRTKHPVPFAIATAVVVFAALVYLGTAVIPSVNTIRQALQVTPELRQMRTGQYQGSPVDFVTALPPMEYTCPYKSPQAWAVFQISRYLSRISRFILRVIEFLWIRNYISYTAYSSSKRLIGPTFDDTMSSLFNWSSIDLEIIQRSTIKLAPPFYELDAFRWVVAELRDSPIMIPHLQNILGTIPLHLVMPAVLDQWFLPDREWVEGDIEMALKLDPPHDGIEGLMRYVKTEFINHWRETGVLYQFLHWMHILMDVEVSTPEHNKLPDLLRRLWDQSVQDEFPSMGTPVPVRQLSRLLKDSRTSELGSRLGSYLTELKGSDDYWTILMKDLGPYIIASSGDVGPNHELNPTSRLVESATGCDFLSKMHNTILEREISKLASVEDDMNWLEAMDIIRRVRRLPDDHFRPIPNYFPIPLSRLEETLNDATLSSTNSESDNDFGVLARSFSKYWDNAHLVSRYKLVEILTKHINSYPLRSNAAVEPATHSFGQENELTESPLIRLSAGLDLIAFVNDRLVEEPESYSSTWYDYDRKAWKAALERVRASRGLPPGYFKQLSVQQRLSGVPRANVDVVEAVVGMGGAMGSSQDNEYRVVTVSEDVHVVDEEDGTSMELVPLAENPSDCGAHRDTRIPGTGVGGCGADRNV